MTLQDQAEVRAPPLWQELMRHAPSMQFFRFCQLLELCEADRPSLGTTDSPASDAVRFRSHASLGFPGREIASATNTTAQAPEVRTTFLGLYGVDARMPSYFIDEIAQQREGAEPLAAFLDLFHHRIVTQYYRVWRKYRYPVGYQRDGRDAVSSYLFSLAGLGWETSALDGGLSPRKLLSMLGLVSQKTRTAEGVVGVLQHAVPDADIRVEEFHPVWITLEGHVDAPLGEHCVLGRGFYDRSQALRVVITPGSQATVLGLLPGERMHEDVMQLLRFYLGYTAQAVLVMRVHPALMPAPALDAHAPALGYTSLLPPGALSEVAQTPVTVQLGIWNRSTHCD